MARIGRRLAPVGIAALLLALAWLAWRTQAAAFVWVEPAAARWTAAAAIVGFYIAFCGRVAWRARAIAENRTTGAFRVLHASQTGFAERIARDSTEALCGAGLATSCLPLGALDVAALSAGGRMLFVASTTGEGDAPDSAYAFVQNVMARRPDLSRLQYGLLALGDRGYQRFCGFGAALDEWLRGCGAQPMFERIDVDAGEAGALQRWQRQLGRIAGAEIQQRWAGPVLTHWRLDARESLNPGSPGGAVFRIVLAPTSVDAPAWQAGDIAEIRVPLPDGTALRREYSIASIPANGVIELIIRQVRDAEGRAGAGSGWLIDQAPVGTGLALSIRENPGFRPPPDDAPMILIGNGTGIAGLCAHLRARAAAGAQRNWLLYGERTSRHDRLCGDEIAAWQQRGVLARADLIFSRDAGPLRYVQDAVRVAADELRRWVDEGAFIFVCGSLRGMAPDVDAALREVLGEGGLDALRAQNRYRRDVY